MNKQFVETELKVLDVNIARLEEIFTRIGAEKTFSGHRYFVTYDFEDNRLYNQDILLRMTATSLNAVSAKVSIHVDNTSLERKVAKFYTDNKSHTEEFLYAIGLRSRTRITSYRISYEWKEFCFDIDQFPGIPPFMEIDGNDIGNKIAQIQQMLQITEKEIMNVGTEELYNHYGIDYYSRFAFFDFFHDIDEYWDIYNEKLQLLPRKIRYGQEANLAENEYYLHIHALLKNKENQYIIIQRAWNSRHYPGEWEIPGGHVLAGERAEEALIREVREETGLDISFLNKMYLGKEIIGKRLNLIWGISVDFDMNALTITEEEVASYRLVTSEEMLKMVSNQCGHNGNFRNLLEQGIDKF